jgi:anti-sigma-K factor RskA
VNLQAYISSGIVESYVLGLASIEEQREFEQYCSQHPELIAARESFELCLEKNAVANAVVPPQQVKENIWRKINESTTPVVPIAQNNNNHAKPVSINTNWLKYAAAVAVILLLGSTLLNFYFYRQYQAYNAKYDALFASTQEMANNNKILQTRNEELQGGIRMMKDPATLPVSMKGTPDAPGSLATLYWNKTTSDVYMLVNNLPALAADQEYQLWAFVDGQPVNAGFLDMHLSDGMLKMKNFARAESFAITLEKKGRANINAPQGKVYVFGKI